MWALGTGCSGCRCHRGECAGSYLPPPLQTDVLLPGLGGDRGGEGHPEHPCSCWRWAARCTGPKVASHSEASAPVSLHCWLRHLSLRPPVPCPVPLATVCPDSWTLDPGHMEVATSPPCIVFGAFAVSWELSGVGLCPPDTLLHLPADSTAGRAPEEQRCPCPASHLLKAPESRNALRGCRVLGAAGQQKNQRPVRRGPRLSVRSTKRSRQGRALRLTASSSRPGHLLGLNSRLCLIPGQGGGQVWGMSSGSGIHRLALSPSCVPPVPHLNLHTCGVSHTHLAGGWI